MVWCFVFLAAEILLLPVPLLARRFKKQKTDFTLTVLTLLCLCCALCSLAGFFSLRESGADSFLFRFIMFCYGFGCVCSDFILCLAAKTFIDRAKLSTKMTKAAFYVFWIFCAVDAVVFFTNAFTHFAYLGTLVEKEFAQTAAVFFYPVSGIWFSVHLCFNFVLVLLIFVAMLLKCTSVPLVYAGKYIPVGLYFFAVAALIFYLEYISFSLEGFYVSTVLLCAVPFIFFYNYYYYRPRFLLSSIRQMVFDKLGIPVVLFDSDDLLIDFNYDAKKLFVLETNLINHLSVGDFLKRSVGNQIRPRVTSTVEEVSIENCGAKFIYQLDYIRLEDKTKKNLGTMMLFHDISKLKELYNSVENALMTDPLTGLSSKVHLQKKNY